MSLSGREVFWIVALTSYLLGQELEVLETRTVGMKTKAETQAKYGW